jgi:hypothetical protein
MSKLNRNNRRTSAPKVDPSTMVLMGQPKIGKSTATSYLTKSIMLMFDKTGGDFLENGYIIQLNSWGEFKELVKELKADVKENGIYDFTVVDHYSILETLIDMNAAKEAYKKSPACPKDWSGDRGSLAGFGQGNTILKEQIVAVIDFLKSTCKHLIILGHVKDKYNKEAGELTLAGVELDALSAKIGTAICGYVDAVGYLYEDATDGSRIINFDSSGNLAGTRAGHIAGKKVILSKKDSAPDWSNIFTFLRDDEEYMESVKDCSISPDIAYIED